MSDGAVVVVATISPKAGEEEAVTQAVLDAVAAVHEEPGCLKYALHRDIGGSDLVMIERWESMEALGVHGRAPALTELGAKLDGRLSGPLDVRVFSAIAAGDADKGTI